MLMMINVDFTAAFVLQIARCLSCHQKICFHKRDMVFILEIRM